MDITIETLRDGDESARAEQVRQAFGRQEPHDLDRPHPGNQAVVGAYEGSRLVGGLTILEQGQYFGGRAVPCAGVASVAVAADARGNNVARRLVRDAFARMHEQRLAISVLYPTTASLYRSVGYEIAGINAMSQIGIGDLPSRQPDGHTVAPASFEQLRSAYEQVAPRYDGWLQRTDLRWQVIEHDLKKEKAPYAIYSTHRDGALVGAVAYRQVPGEQRPVDITAQHLFALDRIALHSLLSLLGAHGTMAGTVRTSLPEWQLGTGVNQSQRLRRTFAMPWMIRLIDACAAVAQRGYNPHVEVEVHLDIHDDILEHHAGPHVLRVRNGIGTLEAGGTGREPVDISELAAAYSGYRTDSAALQAAFTGHPPTLVDFF